MPGGRPTGRGGGGVGALSGLLNVITLAGLLALAIFQPQPAPDPPQDQHGALTDAPVAVQASAMPTVQPAVAPPSRTDEPHGSFWTATPQRVDREAQQLPRVADAAPPQARYDLTLTMPADLRAADSATFIVGGRSYRLDGLEPIAPGTVCKTPQGARAACGRRSVVALRKELLGKTLECRSVGTDGAVTVVECGATGLALAVRLVRDGFAKATPGAPALVKTAAAEAKRERVGIWGNETR